MRGDWLLCLDLYQVRHQHVQELAITVLHPGHVHSAKALHGPLEQDFHGGAADGLGWNIDHVAHLELAKFGHGGAVIWIPLASEDGWHQFWACRLGLGCGSRTRRCSGGRSRRDQRFQDRRHYLRLFAKQVLLGAVLVGLRRVEVVDRLKLALVERVSARLGLRQGVLDQPGVHPLDGVVRLAVGGRVDLGEWRGLSARRCRDDLARFQLHADLALHDRLGLGMLLGLGIGHLLLQGVERGRGRRGSQVLLTDEKPTVLLEGAGVDRLCLVERHALAHNTAQDLALAGGVLDDGLGRAGCYRCGWLACFDRGCHVGAACGLVRFRLGDWTNTCCRRFDLSRRDFIAWSVVICSSVNTGAAGPLLFRRDLDGLIGLRDTRILLGWLGNWCWGACCDIGGGPLHGGIGGIQAVHCGLDRICASQCSPAGFDRASRSSIAIRCGLIPSWCALSIRHWGRRGGFGCGGGDGALGWCFTWSGRRIGCNRRLRWL